MNRLARREAYLIRHGETDWNIQKRWQGIADIPLNAEGERQALLLATFMQTSHTLHHLYSSDLSRAWKTAEVIGNLNGLTPQVDVRLREIDVGLFEGHSGMELDELYPEEIAAYRLGGPCPEGETREQVQARAMDAFQDIIGKTTGNVAFVAHGGWIWQFLIKMFPEVLAGNVPHIHNTSVTTLIETDDGWKLESVGVVAHL